MARVIENPRELILEKAQKILHNEGYSSVSIRRVAKECDIAVGTIYNYFPGKKELIVEMMSNFWEGYFDNIEVMLRKNKDFYVKLRNIFDLLSQIIKRFRAVWLDSEIYSSPDYIESGLKRQDIYVEKLITIVEEMLINDIYDTDSEERKFDSHELASFIVMNFMSMLQMDNFEYDFFEKVIKELI